MAPLCASTDPAFRQINTAGARIELGAGVTMAKMLANRDLPFCTRRRARIGGPAIRNMATVGGNLFAADALRRFHRRAAGARRDVVRCRPATAAREMPLEEISGEPRARRGVGLVAARQLQPPGRRRRVSLPQDRRVKPKGISVLTIAAHLPQPAAASPARAIAYGAMAPTPMRARRRARAGRPSARRSRHRGGEAPPRSKARSPATDAIASAWYRREMLPCISAGCWPANGAEERAMAKTPVQFRLNGSDARSSSRRRKLCSARCGAGSATSRRNTAAARAPAASAPC